MVSKLTAQQTDWVERLLPRVTAIAARMRVLLPHMDWTELIGAGNEALVEAATRYDPEFGVPFSAFAHYRIRGAMLDAARSLVPGSRSIRRAQRQLDASQAVFEQEHRRRSGQAEAAAERVARARSLYEKHAQIVLLSRRAPVAPESVGGREPNPETALLDKERRGVYQRLLQDLSPDDRDLIEALYVREITMNEYSLELGKSPSTISRRHARVLGDLARQAQDLAPPDTPLS